MNTAPGDDNDVGDILVEVTPEPGSFIVRVAGSLDMDSAGSFLAGTVALLD